MKKLLLLLLPLFILPGCDVGKRSGTLAGNDIEEGIRKEIRKNDIRLIKSLRAQDLSGLRNIFSDPMIAGLDHSKDSMLQSFGAAISSGKFKVLDEYYTKNNFEGETVSITNDSRKGREYELSFVSNKKESYVSLMEVEAGPQRRLLLSVVYCRYYTNWLIDIIRLGNYEYNGKNMRVLFNDARQDLKDANLVDAFINAQLANNCANPAPDLLTYQSAPAIKELVDEINRTANRTYHFPLRMDSIASQPEIEGVSSANLNGSYYPLVIYKTQISLKQVAALKAENAKLRMQVGRLFKGIDQHKKYVLYRAINQLPVGSELPESYGFIDTLRG